MEEADFVAGGDFWSDLMEAISSIFGGNSASGNVSYTNSSSQVCTMTTTTSGAASAVAAAASSAQISQQTTCFTINSSTFTIGASGSITLPGGRVITKP